MMPGVARGIMRRRWHAAVGQRLSPVGIRDHHQETMGAIIKNASSAQYDQACRCTGSVKVKVAPHPNPSL